jgi:hypothetical protein
MVASKAQIGRAPVSPRARGPTVRRSSGRNGLISASIRVAGWPDAPHMLGSRQSGSVRSTTSRVSVEPTEEPNDAVSPRLAVPCRIRRLQPRGDHRSLLWGQRVQVGAVAVVIVFGRLCHGPRLASRPPVAVGHARRLFRPAPYRSPTAAADASRDAGAVLVEDRLHPLGPVASRHRVQLRVPYRFRPDGLGGRRLPSRPRDAYAAGRRGHQQARRAAGVTVRSRVCIWAGVACRRCRIAGLVGGVSASL